MICYSEVFTKSSLALRHKTFISLLLLNRLYKTVLKDFPRQISRSWTNFDHIDFLNFCMCSYTCDLVENYFLLERGF